MFTVGGIYPDETGTLWEVISLNGPEAAPVVCKTCNLKCVIRAYQEDGKSPFNNPDLLAATTRWAVLWSGGNIGIFAKPQLVQLPEARSMVKIEFVHGKFDK